MLWAGATIDSFLQEFVIEKRERLVGIKSTLYSNGFDKIHCKLVFVLGKMELA